jgi:uncharacterized protein with HEPN domain
MNDKSVIVLGKILKYAEDALYYIGEMDYEAFVADSKTFSATAFVLGQIGELAKSVDDETQSVTSDINWRGMRGLRNRIVHDYENIDMKMLWDVIKIDLPQLIEKIKVYIATM